MKALVLSLALLLPACSLMQPAEVPVNTTLPAAVQTVQKTITEANILITAAANVVAQNYKDGISTKEEAMAYALKLKDMADKLDSAQQALRLGDLTNAKNQAELIQKAITLLHKEVAAKARKV